MLLQNGSTVEAHVKGNFRIKGIRSTNPVAVGDRVTVESLPDGTNWITDICDRRNYIIRRATNLSKQSHILAANVDQVALLVTVNHPKTSTTFIDRFLATCEAYRVPAALVFNKIDLYDATDMAELEYMRLLYTEIGYPVYCISATRLDHELDGLLSGKTTLLSGNSGVGKSTLLNSLFGEEKTRTGIISDAQCYAQVVEEVVHKAVVVGVVPVVHEAAGKTGLRDELCHFAAVVSETADVVDEVGTRFNSFSRYSVLVGVYRDRYAEVFLDSLDDRRRPVYLLLVAYACAAGAC